MRKLTPLVLVAVFGFELVLARTVWAQTVIVPAFRCAVVFGGSMTVPAGSEIVITQRWGAKTAGLVQDFLIAQTTTIVVNDGPPTDVSDGYDPIAGAPDGSYFTRVFQPTGITLNAGESMTFVLTLELAHQIHDGFTFEDEDNNKKLFFGPGVAFQFPCTITGVAP